MEEVNRKMARRVRKYVGPVKVALQELDGQFPHTFQVGLVQSPESNYILQSYLLLGGTCPQQT